MYSCGPLHMDEQRQDEQFEPTYSISVPIRDVAQKTLRKQWTIGKGGERGSGMSVMIARQDDDDDDDLYLIIVICLLVVFKTIRKPSRTYQKTKKKKNRLWRCPRGLMVKALDSGIVESEF